MYSVEERDERTQQVAISRCTPHGILIPQGGSHCDISPVNLQVHSVWLFAWWYTQSAPVTLTLSEFCSFLSHPSGCVHDIALSSLLVNAPLLQCYTVRRLSAASSPLDFMNPLSPPVSVRCLCPLSATNSVPSAEQSGQKAQNLWIKSEKNAEQVLRDTGHSVRGNACRERERRFMIAEEKKLNILITTKWYCVCVQRGESAVSTAVRMWRVDRDVNIFRRQEKQRNKVVQEKCVREGEREKEQKM